MLLLPFHLYATLYIRQVQIGAVVSRIAEAQVQSSHILGVEHSESLD